MSEAVIVALITAAGAVIAQWFIGKNRDAELYAKLDKQSATSDEKIQGEINVLKADIRTLSNRVEAHNRVVDRTYELERKVGVLEEKASAANRRLSDIERSEKHD